MLLASDPHDELLHDVLIADKDSSVQDKDSYLLPFLPFCNDVLGLQFTPYQEVIARVVGGGDPSGEIAREVWGFEGPIEPFMRAIIALRLGRRGFKTTLSASFCLWRAMVADLTEARGGAPIMVPIVAPSEPGTKIALNMAIHMVTHSSLEDCINIKTHSEARKRNAVTTTSINLVRPHDGMAVELRAVVASPGGKNLVGYHIPAMVLDEAERFRADSDAGITDKEQLDAALPSLLPGGSALMISTCYDFESAMHAHVERNHGHPIDGLAAVATTLQLRPDSEMVKEMVARELLRNPSVAQRDFFCVPMGREDSYFKSTDIDACTIDVAAPAREKVSGAVDLGFISDGSGGLALERQGDVLVQTCEYLAVPKPGAPLLPSVIRRTMGDMLQAAGVSLVAADVHEFASLCEDFIPRGLQVVHAPTGGKVATAAAITRDLLRARQLKVLPQTAAQLKLVLTAPNGEPSMKRSSKGHGDLVSALIAAVWLDRRHGALGGAPQERPQSHKGGWTI